MQRSIPLPVLTVAIVHAVMVSLFVLGALGPLSEATSALIVAAGHIALGPIVALVLLLLFFVSLLAYMLISAAALFRARVWAAYTAAGSFILMVAAAAFFGWTRPFLLVGASAVGAIGVVCLSALFAPSSLSFFQLQRLAYSGRAAVAALVVGLWLGLPLYGMQHLAQYLQQANGG